MMNFRTINNALTTILGAAAAGRYQVVGYQQQGQSAEEIRNNSRTVQSYYSAGQFPHSSGRMTGSTQHSMTFSIGLSVSAASRINLSVINNPDATPGQISSALAAMQDASGVADGLWDELAEMVYQVLMDARNSDLGQSVGTVSNRWVDSIHKDPPNPQGALVVLTGVIQFACNTVETITGDTGVLIGTGDIGTQLDIIGDDVERAGVTV